MPTHDLRNEALEQKLIDALELAMREPDASAVSVARWLLANSEAFAFRISHIKPLQPWDQGYAWPRRPNHD
jgi:hypothetical protein